MNYGDKLWERALVGGIGIVQENEPGVPAQLHNETQENRVRQGG
jgi:hypothetical protein